MRAFRDDVHRTWLINTCATTKCHGGEDAGRLWLYDRKTASDTAAYTNFLILDRFRLPGEDGKLSVPLINYNEPASSPLLQLGLPREEATFKHPEITGSTRAKWRPAFRSTDDERFKQAVAWIKEMYAKRTNYPIDYTPPSPKGAGAGTPAPR
jgi:hypothetical protein